MAQATRRGGIVPEPDDDVPVWEVDGKRYDIDLLDIDGLEWRDITQATRMFQAQVMAQALLHNEFECVAALVWVVRRRSEPKLEYEAVLQGISYRTLRRIDAEEEGETNPPE